MGEEKNKEHFSAGIDPFDKWLLPKGHSCWLEKYQINHFECTKIASTLPNKSVSELIDNAKKIHTFLNS